MTYLIFEQLRWAMDRANVRPSLGGFTAQGWEINLDLLPADAQLVVHEASKIDFGVTLPPKLSNPATTPRVQPTPTIDWHSLWLSFHLRPASFTGDITAELQWLAAFAARLPCGQCRHWFEAQLEADPPILTNPGAYQAWQIDLHNSANSKLGKPHFPMADAMALYPLPGDARA